MSFLNPLFLAASIAVGVPIIVHLVRRERAERLLFSSLRYLRPVVRRRLRHLVLRDRLLLALRCLLVALVVLAFSRPYLEDPAVATGTRSRALIILIDNSASMAGGKLEEAKREARKIVAGMGSAAGTRAIVASFSRSIQAAGEPTADTAVLNALIDKITITHNSTSFLAALRAADQLLARFDEPEKTIYLVSDLQRSGFDASEPLRLGRGTKLVPVAVGGPHDNAAIMGVELLDQERQSGPPGLAVHLRNFGRAANIDLSLKMNGSEVGRRRVALERDGSSTVSFHNLPLFPGTNRGEAAISGDPFDPDNRFFFTIDRGRELRVLLVERKRDASFYLKKALALGIEPRFRVTPVSEAALRAVEIDHYDLVVASDIDSPIPGLESFLQRGGGAVFFSGKEVEPESFNRSFARIAPARLVKPKLSTGRESARFLTSIKWEHPIFQALARGGAFSFAGSRFSGFFAAEPAPSAFVAARFDDGSPAIIEGRPGRGTVLLFALSAGADWGDLPLSPIYLPLVHEAAKYAGGYRPAKSWRTVGEELTLEEISIGLLGHKSAARPAQPAVREPERDELRIVEETLQLESPGFYELRSERQVAYLAANIDPAESDLKPMEPRELIAAVEPPAPSDNLESSRAELLSPQELEGRQRLWRYLLALALLLLLLESIMANVRLKRT